MTILGAGGTLGPEGTSQNIKYHTESLQTDCSDELVFTEEILVLT